MFNTEYPKIETLYERDPFTFKLLPELILKNPVYGLLKTWEWTEKVDGTNIRAVYTPEENNSDDYMPAYLYFGGRTEAAQIHADLFNWLKANITVEKMKAAFPDATPGEPIVLYGEGCGPGIQKNGADYSPIKKLVLFDVKVGKWWLSFHNVQDVGNKLGIDVVPFIDSLPLEVAAAYIRNGVPSVLAAKNGVVGRRAEGWVGRPSEALFDKKGHRLIVKLKTNDFAPSAEGQAEAQQLERAA